MLLRRCSVEPNKQRGATDSLDRNFFSGEGPRTSVNYDSQIIRQSPSFNFRILSHIVWSVVLWSVVLLSREAARLGTIALASIVWTTSRC